MLIGVRLGSSIRRHTAVARFLRRFVLAALFLVGGSAVPGFVPLVGSDFQFGSTAFADDDDDGGDDDDDGGGGSGGAYGGSRGGGRGGPVYRPRGNGIPILRNLFNRFTQRAPRRQARRSAPPPPANAPGELVAVVSADDLTAAEGMGFDIIADEEVDLVGNRLARLRIPAGLTLAEARQRLVNARPTVAADLNHYYRPEIEPECSRQPCLARSLIGWPASGALSSATPRIGLVDTGINLAHEALKDQKIDFTDLSGKPRNPSSKVHGTAVAALLVGSRDSRAPGLLPEAELVAVDAFHRSGRDDRTDVFDLVRAMNIVASKDVDVLNLSLTGPDNAVLERAVAEIAEKDIMMVAAAGNKGPNADPLYPAAYPNVTVATAVDRRHRAYRRAGRGEHVDFSAPGVNVWAAASIRGARLKTGTSFAAPFVTAAIGYIRARSPEMTRAQVKEMLAATVEDLGDPGRDPVFGWGLLRMDRLAADSGALPKQGSVEPGVLNGASGSVVPPPTTTPKTFMRLK